MDRRVLNPRSPEFNPLRALEYGADPVHFIIGRRSSAAGSRFVNDIRNGRLERDLGAYRGFGLGNLVSGGVVDARWGYTFDLQTRDGEQVQGLYVGGGPSLSVQTDFSVDSGLQRILGGVADTETLNQRFGVSNQSSGHAAVAATGGYRARVQFRRNEAAHTADAAYLAVNVNYLHGLRYEDLSLRLRLDTDGTGLLTTNERARRRSRFRVSARVAVPDSRPTSAAASRSAAGRSASAPTGSATTSGGGISSGAITRSHA